MKEIKKSANFTSKQKGKDVKFNIDLNYSPEYDSFIIKVKEGEGFMAYSSNIERMPLKVIQKLNEMLEEVLIKAGSKTEMEEQKMFNGGDFQSGVYEKGGSLAELNKKVMSYDKPIEYKGNMYATIYGANFRDTVAGTKKGDIYWTSTNKELLKQINKEIFNSDGSVMPFYELDPNIFILSVELSKIKSNYEFGGNFQSGVYADGGYFDGTIPKASSYMTTYAKGGSLEAHGIEIGDTFVKTISGNIQKIKDKNGKIVYVDLSTGERDSQPPLPFDDGGDIDLTDDNVMRVRKPAMPTRKLTNQEIAEKYNASAYEYMETDKKAFGGGLFSRAKMMTKAKKYPDLEDKNVTLKNGKLVKVFSQNENKLKVIEFGKIGSGVTPTTIDISEVENVYNNGGALVGNQKRIDMNKNGKIDAEDFKLLRSSMNGAWRNERKHVNHNEDYEVRYARKKPSRTGYKGKRKFGEGGGIGSEQENKPSVFYFYDGENERTFSTLEKALEEAKYVDQHKVRNNLGGEYFVEYEDIYPKKNKFATGGGISNFERFSNVVAKNYEGKSVKPKYQKEYGKTYSKSEAKQVGNRVAGKVKMMKKAESGAEVKKGNRGGVMVLAKKIRKDGESWKDALKRAGQQMK